MSNLKVLSESYFINGVDRTFARGRRAHLTYALPSAHAAFSKVNRSGPDPDDYLEYARGDLATGSEQGPLNAIGNAKRAVHQAVDAFLLLHGLDLHYKNRNFPKKLELLGEIGAFPIRLVESLNQRRNLLEHEYVSATREEAESLVEVAEMFLGLAYGFLRQSVIGVYAGKIGSDECFEYFLDPLRATIFIAEVTTPLVVPSEHGHVHVNIKQEDPRQVIDQISLTLEDKKKWLPYLDLLVYCTRRSAFKLLSGGPPGAIAIGRRHISYTAESGALDVGENVG